MPAPDIAHRERPALVLLGAEALDKRVERLIAELRAASPGSKIVLVHRDAGQDAASVSARAAADGCVTWVSLDPEGLAAVLAAHTAGYWIGDGEATHDMLASVARREADAKHPPLAERERDVLSGLREGLTEAGIATELNIGVRTVQDAVQRLKHKFGAETVAQLMHLAGSVYLEGGEG